MQTAKIITNFWTIFFNPLRISECCRKESAFSENYLQDIKQYCNFTDKKLLIGDETYLSTIDFVGRYLGVPERFRLDELELIGMYSYDNTVFLRHVCHLFQIYYCFVYRNYLLIIEHQNSRSSTGMSPVRLSLMTVDITPVMITGIEPRICKVRAESRYAE